MVAASVEALSQQLAALSQQVAALAATQSTLSATQSTLSATQDTHTAALSCDASGRRLDNDAASATSPDAAAATSAKQVMNDFLASRPRLAQSLTDEQLADIEELGQHFGLPARA